MAKRALIDSGTDMRYVRWYEQGRFKESDNVGRSQAADPLEATPRTMRRRFRGTAAIGGVPDGTGAQPYE